MDDEVTVHDSDVITSDETLPVTGRGTVFSQGSRPGGQQCSPAGGHQLTSLPDGQPANSHSGRPGGLTRPVAALVSVLVSFAEVQRRSQRNRQGRHPNRDTCDLAHPGTPSASLGIIQAHRDSLRYLVLGDVTLVIETTGGLRIVTDNRVTATASAERAAADALPAGSPEKAKRSGEYCASHPAARDAPSARAVDPGDLMPAQRA